MDEVDKIYMQLEKLYFNYKLTLLAHYQILTCFQALVIFSKSISCPFVHIQVKMFGGLDDKFTWE